MVNFSLVMFGKNYIVGEFHTSGLFCLIGVSVFSVHWVNTKVVIYVDLQMHDILHASSSLMIYSLILPNLVSHLIPIDLRKYKLYLLIFFTEIVILL